MSNVAIVNIKGEDFAVVPINEYKEQKGAVRLNISAKKLQALCTNIADTMPVVSRKGAEPKPWGCKITVEKTEVEEWYCDGCPVTRICPNPDQSYSK